MFFNLREYEWTEIKFVCVRETERGCESSFFFFICEYINLKLLCEDTTRPRAEPQLVFVELPEKSKQASRRGCLRTFIIIRA